MKRGFTLIELLVVIAIIGVLSAVVLASLNTARNKGNDAAVKADLDGIRAQATLYYDDHGNYGTNASTASGCGTADTLFTDAKITDQIAAANAANGTVAEITCNVAANGTAYAVSGELITTAGTYYCVDSAGAATTGSTALGATATSCQ